MDKKKKESPSITTDEIKKLSQEKGDPSKDKNAYIDPGPKPDGFFKILKWRRKVRKERRKLRRRLKEKGITDRETFEKIAWELGLILDDGKGLLWWDWLKWLWSWIKTSGGLKALIGLLAALLFLIFIFSYLVSEISGAFTINITGALKRNGFVLYDSIDFETPYSRLFSEKVKDISNIQIDEIVNDVDDTDGAHNGTNYVAYTFYIRNEGEEAGSYTYTLSLNDSSFNVEDAVWIMLFEDGHQLIYAKASSDGDPEKIYGFDSAPFVDYAYSLDQYYTKGGLYGIKTTAFIDDDNLIQGIVENVQPGEYHKYTVVLWLEGSDPECTDDLFGGFAKYSMTFDITSNLDHNSIFSGVYRTEYSDYANGIITNEDEEEASDSESGISATK